MAIVVTSPVTAVISTADGLDDGTVGAPSVAFLSDATTGLYKSAGATVGIACGGAVKQEVDATTCNHHDNNLTNVGNITCKATGKAITNLNAATGIAAGMDVTAVKTLVGIGAGVDITAVKSLAFIGGLGAITNCSSIDSPDATSSVHGQMPAADKKFLDRSHAAAGTDLTDTATQTIQITSGAWRKLPVLGQGGTLTLGTTGAVAGDQLEVTRTDVSAFTYAIVNGGAGAGTLYTMAVSKIGCALFQFDGTNWALRSFGVQ